MKDMILENEVFWFVVYTIFITVSLFLFNQYIGI